MLTRRQLLAGAGGAVAGGAVLGAGFGGALGDSSRPLALVPLGAGGAGVPQRQHAWGANLILDGQGDAIAPRYDRLLFFSVRGHPSPAHARMLEASLRTLERTFPWRSDGLLFAAAWGPSYFERRLDTASPVPRARSLSAFELPAIDDYDLCLHLAGDDERRLADVEAALVRGAPLAGSAGWIGVNRVLRWRETRTGFAGPGLPAAHQRVGGIPAGDPVAATAPLFMGFKSNLRRNQAREADVTISDGRWAGGTTMHVSYMRLRLDSWYGGLSERQRVARMYAPQVTPEQAAHFTTDAPSDPSGLGEAIRRYGVIGHSQSSARARRNGRPIILRRDFNTVDGGQAGLHFVSVQRSIEDFVAVRTAMNQASVQLDNPAITDTVNNGINEFIFVLKRANFIVPTRAERAFPMVAGRDRVLT